MTAGPRRPRRPLGIDARAGWPHERPTTAVRPTLAPTGIDTAAAPADRGSRR
jgi:hypothetical protein